MSQEYSIIYSEDFYRDLKEIHFYIAKKLKAPQSADKIAHQIYSVAESLSFTPERFAAIRFSANPEDYKRRVPCGNYGIYYRVIEKKMNVHILRVIRKGRDAAKLIIK